MRWRCVVAISFVGSASAESDSLTLPTHQAGDLLLIFAAHATGGASSTQPIIPSGWNSASNRNAVSHALRTAWKIASESGTPSGTWTNATHIACAVYRHTDNFMAVGAATNFAANTTTARNWDSLDIQTSGFDAGNAIMRFTDSWAVLALLTEFIGSNDSTPPTGYTHREQLVGATFGELNIFDSNAAVASTNPSRTSNTSARYLSSTTEISALTISKSMGGGSSSLLHPLYATGR